MKTYEKAKQEYFRLRQEVNLTRLMGGHIYSGKLWGQAREIEKQYPRLRYEWDDSTNQEIDSIIKGN